VSDLVVPTASGLHCPAGDFHVDPWRPVARAVITHAHADHARPGSGRYLTAEPGRDVLRIRMGEDARIDALAYGEHRRIGDVDVSLHPAGHLLGSAQVRLERDGEVWVISGDYKTDPDPTCTPFEPVRADVFITESTFGLPVFRWPDPGEVFAEIDAWWAANRARGRTSLLFAYALGKAQRVLAGLDRSAGPILAHGAVRRLDDAYRAAGIDLPPLIPADADTARTHRGEALVVAPPSALGTPWMRKFQPASTAFVSGWMRLRGTRRRRSADRGFVLSDHADWPGLLDAIAATGAERVGVTHGSSSVLVRWLSEQGKDAWVVPTEYVGERVDEVAESDHDGIDDGGQRGA